MSGIGNRKCDMGTMERKMWGGRGMSGFGLRGWGWFCFEGGGTRAARPYQGGGRGWFGSDGGHGPLRPRKVLILITAGEV